MSYRLTTEQRALVDPPLLDLAEPGFRLSALEYRRLEQARENFGRRMVMLHARYDLLVTRQLATTAFAAGHEVPPESQMKRWWEWSPFTYPFNLTQQPAAAVPCGFTQSGMANAGRPIVGVRVGLKNGGCAGMTYTMEYAEKVEPSDEVVGDKGVRVLIDPKAVLFLLGTEMGYKVEKLAAQFVFNNPNQTSACGCGESVQVTPATETH